MSFNPVIVIAKNEIRNIMGHPILFVVGVILVILAYLNGVGGYHDLVNLEKMQNYYSGDTFFLGFSQTWYSTAMICNILAVFLGVTTIAEERWNNNLNTLITKPLYRRDIVIGKYLGITFSLFIFTALTLLVTALMLILYFREPLSYSEFVWRLSGYILILAFSITLVSGLSMLLGVVFKNYVVAITLAVAYVYAEWFMYLAEYFGNFAILMPRKLYMTICDPTKMLGVDIFNSNLSFSSWFSSALPYVVFLMLEIAITIILCSYLFTREDVS